MATFPNNLVTLATGQYAEIGCHIGGHAGWHVTPEAIYLAEHYGMPLAPEDAALVRAYDASDDAALEAIICANPQTYEFDLDSVPEIVQEISDDADTYLNSITPEGYVWHWHDGEYFLSLSCGVDHMEACAHCGQTIESYDWNCQCECHTNI